MGNYFKIHYNAVKYPIDSEKSRGLRNAQLGAIHAISSFFTLNKKEAAIVIMPTGSGKTAVLMLTPYLIRNVFNGRSVCLWMLVNRKRLTKLSDFKSFHLLDALNDFKKAAVALNLTPEIWISLEK